MWYRTVVASLPGINGTNGTNELSEKASSLEQEIQGMNIPAEEFFPELEKMLKEMNFDFTQYKKLPDHAKKNIWDIIVHKYDTNLYNNFEDSDTPGFDATEARRHSPYHSNPSETTLEEQLEATRHDTVDRTPNNMQQAEKGNGGYTLLNGNGAPQLASGKGARMFYDNLPSNITLV